MTTTQQLDDGDGDYGTMQRHNNNLKSSMHVVPINVLEHRLSIQCVEHRLLNQRVEHRLSNQRGMND